MRYVIRVKGHLDPFWQEWFEHLSITHQSDGTTLLSGQIRDHLKRARPNRLQKSEQCLSGCASSVLLCGRHGSLPD